MSSYFSENKPDMTQEQIDKQAAENLVASFALHIAEDVACEAAYDYTEGIPVCGIVRFFTDVLRFLLKGYDFE
jgi:uncharacterized membrane protein